MKAPQADQTVSARRYAGFRGAEAAVNTAVEALACLIALRARLAAERNSHWVRRAT